MSELHEANRENWEVPPVGQLPRVLLVVDGSGDDAAVIETERLRLRELTEADTDNLLKISGDPVAMEFWTVMQTAVSPHPTQKEQLNCRI